MTNADSFGHVVKGLKTEEIVPTIGCTGRGLSTEITVAVPLSLTLKP